MLQSVFSLSLFLLSNVRLVLLFVLFCFYKGKPWCNPSHPSPLPACVYRNSHHHLLDARNCFIIEAMSTMNSPMKLSWSMVLLYSGCFSLDISLHLKLRFSVAMHT